MKNILFVIMLGTSLLFLASCVSSGQTNTDFNEEVTTVTGYVYSKSPERIWFTMDLKATDKEEIFNGIIFDVSDIDDALIAEVEAGQKVELTHYRTMAASSPPEGLAIELKILEEK